MINLSESICQQLQNPEAYPHKVGSIQLIQTHISYVFLTGPYVYKIKKPVNFGFLDFSTLEKRKHYCEEEIRLNQRLCPQIYLEVVPITLQQNDLKISGSGKIVEYAVLMKQFPQNLIMQTMLKHKAVDKEVIENICDTLITFYEHQDHSDELDAFGRLEAVKKNIDENFEQTQSKIGCTLSKDIFQNIQKMNHRFFSEKRGVFDRRIKQGHIHDCHGDLHSGNIVLTDPVCIFDCIEFNNRFRYCDVASDLAFLAMDLDFLNHPFLSSYFISQYREKSGDRHVLDVLNFYKSYRAYVRGKVAGFTLDDPQINEVTKNDALQTAQLYFKLSHFYARLITANLDAKKPFLFMVCGLSGTGKSTVAEKIAVDFKAHLINTDIVRKEVAGINKYEPHHEPVHTGLYAPKNIDQTYHRVIQKAQTILKEGKSVVLDATFIYHKHRKLVEVLAQQLQIPLFIVQCICDAQIVKKRMEKRLTKKAVSDARWEIYQHQVQTLDPFNYQENYLEFDTDNTDFKYRLKKFNDLITLVMQEVS